MDALVDLAEQLQQGDVSVDESRVALLIRHDIGLDCYRPCGLHAPERRRPQGDDVTSRTPELLAPSHDARQRRGTARVGDRVVDDALNGAVRAGDGSVGDDEPAVRT